MDLVPSESVGYIQNMSYQEIKDRIRHAETLVNEGKLDEADTHIRATIGATPRDLTINLAPSALAKLRKFAKKKARTMK